MGPSSLFEELTIVIRREAPMSSNLPRGTLVISNLPRGTFVISNLLVHLASRKGHLISLLVHFALDIDFELLVPASMTHL